MQTTFAVRLGCLTFLLAAASACLAQQGGTVFIPPSPVPAQGQPYHKDDPAYPKYLDIYNQIQANFGSASALQPAARAIAELQQAYPSSPYPAFALAEYKYALVGQNPRGNPEAMAILDGAMRANGADIPDGYILKAKIAADQGDGEAALRYANIAVNFAPDKSESQFALARAQDISGNHEQAEAAYRKFISLVDDPRRKGNGYAWLAISLSNPYLPRDLQIANRDKAAEALRMSAQLAPSYPHLMHYASYLVTDVGDTDAAAAQLGRILAQDGSDDEARFYMGLAEYLKWAKANPKGGHALLLADIQRHWGLSKEDAFVSSAAHYALEPVVVAMLNGHVVKNVDVPCSDSCTSFPPGASALVNAAYADSADLVKRLVERGANINIGADGNRTPLMYALLNENIELAAYLLGKGARVNVAAQDGMTPLGIAVSHPATGRKTVSLLLKYHADASGAAGGGMPYAIVAIRSNNVDALDVLIAQGKIDVNFKDSHGYPLLYYALRNPDMVRLLLAKGADPWVSAGNGDLLERGATFPPESSALVQDARKNRPKQ